MKNFVKGDLFAWGRTIHRAEEACEVVPSVLHGHAAELIVFSDECEPEMALKVCAAIGADATHLVIGSDTGEDGSEDEDA